MEYTIKSLLDTEIGEVIDANARGDYRARVSVEDKSGALLLLAQTINRLGQATTEGLEQIRGTLSASLAGEDGHSIEGDYHGLIGEIQTDVQSHDPPAWHRGYRHGKLGRCGCKRRFFKPA